MAYQVYGNAGLGQANPDNLEMIVTPQDQNPDTFTLLVEDDAGMPAATISIFYDFGRRALPCYELYPEETRRFCGGKTAEVCRLAIAEKYRHLNSLVTHMINVSFLHGFLQKTEDCLIEVHPRHAAFYRRFLLFELLGSEKPCGRVNGSPALLLHLPMGRFRKEVLIGRSAKKAGQNLPRKNSYHAFVGETEEKVLIRYLRNQMTPMSHEEKKYFQIFTG